MLSSQAHAKLGVLADHPIPILDLFTESHLAFVLAQDCMLKAGRTMIGEMTPSINLYAIVRRANADPSVTPALDTTVWCLQVQPHSFRLNSIREGTNL